MTDGNAPVARGYPEGEQCYFPACDLAMDRCKVHCFHSATSPYRAPQPLSDALTVSGLCDGITDENRHPEVPVSSGEKWRTKYREIFNENKGLRAQLEGLLDVAQSEKEAEHQSEMTAWQCVGLQNEIKRLSGLLADAQRIIAEYQASTIARARADVAAHGMPGARGPKAVALPSTDKSGAA
jgi:hypothetical protein